MGKDGNEWTKEGMGIIDRGMVSVFSWNLPNFLINKKLLPFYLKFFLHGSLGWHECTDAAGADVS